jgi:hypothetical protein
MGFLDRLLGRESTAGGRQTGYEQPRSHGREPHAAGASADERAVARYKYLLRTASPDQLEQIHAEAFAQLTPEQRRQVLTELSRDLPPGEQVGSDSPQDLARVATRAEMRRPGYLENAFSRGSFGGGYGMGGSIVGSMMGTIGGVIIGSAIADALFDGYDSSPEAEAAGDTAADGSDQGSVDDSSAGDAGTDSGGWGASSTDDFGGGDFGDFGGGGDF